MAGLPLFKAAGIVCDSTVIIASMSLKSLVSGQFQELFEAFHLFTSLVLRNLQKVPLEDSEPH